MPAAVETEWPPYVKMCSNATPFWTNAWRDVLSRGDGGERRIPR